MKIKLKGEAAMAKNTIQSVFFVLVMCFCLAGCNARVRTVHLAPQAGAADVYVGKKLVQSDLEYKDISGYSASDPGLVDFKLLPTAREGPVLADGWLKLYINQYVTVAAVGTSSADMHLVMYSDDLETDSFNAKVRIIHASPDAPSLDVAVNRIEKDGTINTTYTEYCEPKEPEYKNLCFKDASTYETFNPGNYEIKAYIATSNTTAVKIPQMTLCPGMNYTIFIVGLTRDNSLTTMSVIDSGQEGP
jgi:hypothetical protein